MHLKYLYLYFLICFYHFQVITLIHTLFRYPELGIKTVLVVTPHATIENWCKEFNKWLSDIHEDKNFYILSLTE